MTLRHTSLFLIVLTAIASRAQISVHGAGAYAADTTLYHEPYRPQYHFTPAHRWIGDPCGLIKHDGRYMAYSWGAAESQDLVHWTEINRDAILELPENVAPFTGSVVVDKNNTSGWGNDALVAAFTSFDRDSKKQSQSIAFSHDGGKTFRYYDLNPVIDIWSTEFRDPTVIRFEPAGKWVMAVAKALEKKVAFYESDDLKHWTWTSDFGPMGDNEKSWECPDLFQLEVEQTGEKKWVLLVSVNWAREQYFIGDFDGKRFIPDTPYAEPLYVDDGLDYYASRVFQNYDESDAPVYTIGWVNTWDYAQQAPSAWGKGVWSLPRRLFLSETPDGLRLRQLPAENLSVLRGAPYSFERRLRAGITELPKVSDMDNCYELKVDIKPAPNDVVGLNLCCGDGRKVSVSYNSASGFLTVDRTNSTDASLPKFSRIACTHISGNPEFRIFTDKSTVEIFTADGSKVLTLLTYAAPDQTGAELFSLRGGSSVNLTAWPMSSIHQ
ncbi:MAG: glycoside hydrolase family 32 protein [Muribaculaceae bacterium]|nr:glycoside hydrolase family 32 protein [Muribaculaceae bacterium]